MRVSLARGLKPLAALPGTLRFQRWLAPHRIARRTPSAVDYPVVPSETDENNPRWCGSPATFVGWNAHFRGAYEHETLGVLASLLRPGDSMIEVGGNEGFHSVFAAWCVGPRGHVFTFEPNPVPRATLAANIERLGWGDRVTISDSAVADVSGPRHFFVPGDTAENQGVGGFVDNSRVPTSPILVDATTLDDELADRQCAAIKLDVQGAEALVLRGAAQLIRRCKPYVYFEVDDGGAIEAMTFLQDQNYELKRVRATRRAPFFEVRPLPGGAWTGNCLAVPR